MTTTIDLGTGIDPRIIQARDAIAKFDIPIDPPNLKFESLEFDFNDPPFDPIQFSKDLVDTMVAYAGLGLAAPQIVQNYRIIAIRGEPMIVMFNPKIVSTSEELIELEEGCLSFPGLYVKLTRPREIRVRYTEPNGNVVTKKFENLTARVVLHEIDHLNGVRMVDLVHPIHKEKMKKKIALMKKLGRPSS